MSEAPLNDELLEEFRREFYADPKNQFAQNVCSRMDPMEASVSRERFNQTQHFFTHKIDTEGKPVSDQKNTGRCWIFACLNAIRLPFMKENNLEEFEFSQAFIFFWDKIERSNFFLHNAIKTARRGEAVDGRLVSFLLQDPLGDGGQWDMVVNVINKHGLVPKKLFPDTASCEKSARMNTLLRSKLREYCKVLRELVEQGADDERLQTEIRSQMSTIYRIVSICIGTPPKTFKWEYYTKSKEYKSVGPVSPHDFYHKHVKPTYNMDDKVCLVTDPRSTNQFGKAFTIDCLGNVVGGRPIVYNNQQVELLMELGAKSIKDNEPVWFGCDVSKRLAVKEGIEDLKIHDYQLVFGVDVHLGMTKAERLMFGDSAMTHAMVFSGVSMEGDKPVKWRVENSWGEEHGQKGYFVMTSDWFKEFVFELVVDKKYVPEHVMKVFELEPIVLPAWDPMGTLA